jgi:hypothetical protein
MAAALLVERGDAAPNSPPGPEVRVVNTETNPVPVVVVNPTTKPVLVRQVDSGAVQPLSIKTNAFQFGTAGDGSGILYTVPSGKRLVIEYLSAIVFVQTGQKVLLTKISGAQDADLIAIPSFVGQTVQGFDFFQSSQLVKGYVDAGGTVEFLIQRDSFNGQMFFKLTMTGYLVDVP